MNLVVADDNLYYTKSLINYLTVQYPSLKLIGICTNGKEVLNILSHTTVDLLILDLKMPILDGINLLKSIDNLELHVIPTIFVISGEDKLISKIINNPLVSYYISKSNSLETISHIIGQFIHEIFIEKELFEVQQFVCSELQKLSFNFKHIGTKYLERAILFAYENYDKNPINNLEQHIYKEIALRNSTTIKNVKSNICKATNMMYAECDQTFLEKYFFFDVKPTPKIIITTILNNINSKFNFLKL